MSRQTAHARHFQHLHKEPKPLVLFNAWDAGSARAIAAGGAAAIATGSWSVAAAHGIADGEALAFELVCANAARIVAAVDVPVSIDVERGYGADPQAVGRAIGAVIAAGAIGCNIEDGMADGSVRPAAEQVARLRAARMVANGVLPDFFMNVRTDLFLGSDPATHASLLDEAIARAAAYQDAGASGFFVPGLADEGLIERLVGATSLPVNIMVMDSTPTAQRLAALGVARISHGPRPYLAMMSQLERAAREALAAG